MNFLAVLKQIFPSRPTLDEFVKSHNPVDTLDVERLERMYDKIVRQSGFYQ